MATLEATQQRFTDECVALCDAYHETASHIKDAERDKKDARDALAEHRARAFKKYETSVNSLLRKFNADCRLEDFSLQDGRGGLSSQYQIGVNKATVPLAPKGKDPEPSFRTALSAGDRTTLALVPHYVFVMGVAAWSHFPTYPKTSDYISMSLVFCSRRTLSYCQ